MKAKEYAERLNRVYEIASDDENGSFLYYQEVAAVAYDMLKEADAMRKKRNALGDSAVRACVREAVNKAAAVRRFCPERLAEDWFIQCYNKFLDSTDEFKSFLVKAGYMDNTGRFVWNLGG